MSIETDQHEQLEASLAPAELASLPSDLAPQLVRTVIRPTTGWQLMNARELWQYRELLYFLTWRDVKVRYKQTLLGAAWAVLQPLMMMVVFSVFFGRLAHVDSGGWPYPLFAFAGLLPWTFFATAIANASNSVVGSERLITKIYFPRLAIPFASVGAALVDFAVACSMLVVLMLYYGVSPTWRLLLAPGVILLFLLAALGVGTLLAALNVAYRDIRYVIPFLVQLWMFATPSIYMQPANEMDSGRARGASPLLTESAQTVDRVGPLISPTDPQKTAAAKRSPVPRWIKTLLNLNPMTGLIAFFRAAVLGGALPWRSLAWSTLGSATAFVIGCLYFRRVEDSFADII